MNTTDRFNLNRHKPQVRTLHPARKPPFRHLGIPRPFRGLSIFVIAINAVAAGRLHAQTANVGVVANDSAANDTLPSNPPGSTSTGGFGFGNWTSFGFTGAGNNGAFNGVSNNNGFTGGTNIGNTNAWGLYDNNGASVGAFRNMTTGLQVGQSLSFDYDNGFIDTGKRQEVVLFSSGTGGTDRISFGFTGGGSAYTITNAQTGATLNTFATGFVTSGLHVTITLTSATTYSATIGNAGTTDVVTGTLTGTTGTGTALSGVTIKDNDTTSGAAHDYFTNSLYEYTPTVIVGGSTLASSTTYSGGNSRIATVGSSLNFDGPSGGTVTNGNIGTLYNIAFNATASGANTNGTTNAASYTLTGNGGGSSVTLTGGVNNNSTNLQTINSNLTLGAAQTFNATNAGLTFGGTIETNGKTVTVDGNNNTSFAQLNNTPGTNTGAASIIKNGSGTLTLTGTVDNLNMSAIVNAGTVVLAKSPSGPGGLGAGVRALGSGLTIAGGVAQLGGTGGDQLYDGSSVTVTSGAFDTNARSETISNLGLAGTGLSSKGALLNDAGSGAAALTVSGTTTLTANTSIGVTNSAASMTLTSDVTGASTLSKVGAGTLTVVSKTTNGIAPGVIDIHAGTLLLGGSNIIANSTSITLSGGTFATGINEETVGALTLSATSRIDLGTDSLGQLIFANSSSQSWTGSQTLFIDNWSGTATGGGAEGIYFGTGGLVTAQLGEILFHNPVGFAAGDYGAQILGSGEIVPVPEPSALFGAAGLLGLVGWRERRRFFKDFALTRRNATRIG